MLVVPISKQIVFLSIDFGVKFPRFRNRFHLFRFMDYFEITNGIISIFQKETYFYQSLY